MMRIKMKSMVWMSVLSASCMLAHAAGVDVTLINRTGYPMGSVSLSPAQMNQWSSDKLGHKRLDDGASRRVMLAEGRGVPMNAVSKGGASCLQDVRIVFEDEGDEVIWRDIDVCHTDTLTLRYNRSTGAKTALLE
jgi:hypothetical protein